MTSFLYIGGPLLRQTNGDLIGVASFFYGNQLPELTIELQIWTKIQAYYEWISEVTGLELPNCWFSNLIDKYRFFHMNWSCDVDT